MIGTEFFNGMKIDSAHLKGCKARIELGLGAGEVKAKTHNFLFFYFLLIVP